MTGGVDMRKMEAFYGNSADRLVDVFCLNDIEGNLLEVNKAATVQTGYSKEELLQMKVFDLYSGGLLTGNLLKCCEKQAVDQSFLFEAKRKSKDGSFLPVMLTLVPIHIENQKYIVVLSRGVDNHQPVVEAPSKNYARLRELISTKDKFFSIIAHDMKNIFNGLINISELLVFQVKSRDYIHMGEYCNFLHEAAKTGYALLENLLEWARVQTGQLKYTPVYLSVHDIIQRVIDTLEVSLRVKDIDINVLIESDVRVFADGNMLETVIRNLLSNAIKFSYPGGSVKILVQHTAGGVKLSFIDSGVGIKKEHLPTLFNMDCHHHIPGTNNEPGTGLGLLLCNEFIHMHGGEIVATSEEGKGSTFYFTLPHGRRSRSKKCWH